MALTVENITTEVGVDVVAVGEVDVSCAQELRAAIDEALAGEATEVRVDLSQVPYIDSTGIGVLVGAVKRAAEADKRLVVARPQRNVRRTLDLLGLQDELGIEDCEA